MNIFYFHIRHLINQGFTTIVNFVSLTIGFMCCIVIGLFIKNEISYNNFHTKQDNIYRVLTYYPENGDKSANVTYRIADDLAKNISGVVSSVRFYNFWGPYLISSNGISFNENNLYYVDSSVVDIFTFKFLWGNTISALSDPGTAIITRSTSTKFFGKENPLGKSLNIDKTIDVRITGVVEDFPENSDLKFSILVYDPSRLKSWGKWIEESWQFTNFYTYVLLSPNYSVQQFQNEFKNFCTTRVDSSMRKYVPGLKLQKLPDVHLYSADVQDDYESQGSIKLVLIFVSIAVCILILACTNYICLSISDITKRSKDIEIRIIHGAMRFNISWLYIGESVTLSVLSFLVAMFISGAIQPFLSEYADFYFNINEMNNLSFVIFFVCIITLVSIVSGKTISGYVMRHKKSEIANRNKPSWLKSFSSSGIYTFFQFFVSIVLIVCTIFIFKQLRYMQNTDMGFNPNLVINISVDKTFSTAFSLRDNLLKNSNIENVTFASSLPPSPYHYGSVSSLDEPSIEGISAKNFLVDFSFIDFMEMKIIHGRNFSKDFGTDLEHSVIINKALADKMKWKDAIGKRLRSSYTKNDLVVIGVVENFHFRSFRETIEPVAIVLSEKDNLYNMGIRLRQGYDLKPAINFIRSAWEKVNPGYPFEYQFLDQKIADNYNKEKKQSHILLLFSFLAVAMAGLGLAAISRVYAKQRTKEIGIRKINGSEIPDILILLNKEFIIWIVSAILAGIPVSYITMRAWLENFAYRIELSWPVFILGSIIVLVIAIVTISCQSWYTASRNPVEALRYE